MIVALVSSAVLAVACVLYVAAPFLRAQGVADDRRELDERAAVLVSLSEERDRALAALQELERDHRGGRIADDEYRSLVGDLRREAAQALRALDRARAEQDLPMPLRRLAE